MSAIKVQVIRQQATRINSFASQQPIRSTDRRAKDVNALMDANAFGLDMRRKKAK
jgi:hypothetical protein